MEITKEIMEKIQAANEQGGFNDIMKSLSESPGLNTLNSMVEEKTSKDGEPTSLINAINGISKK